jgi:hypothetical protein
VTALGVLFFCGLSFMLGVGVTLWFLSGDDGGGHE